jgi:hypothetical protein
MAKKNHDVFMMFNTREKVPPNEKNISAQSNKASAYARLSEENVQQRRKKGAQPKKSQRQKTSGQLGLRTA